MSDWKTSNPATVRRTRRAALLSAYLLLAISAVAAAQTPPIEEEPSALRSGTREVLLDLVVLDQRRRSIREVIYPAPQSDATPELFLQYLRDGEVVAQSKPDLPEPRSDGSIAYIATAPASSFPAGQYLVNVVLKQGDAGVVERAFFQVSP